MQFERATIYATGRLRGSRSNAPDDEAARERATYAARHGSSDSRSLVTEESGSDAGREGPQRREPPGPTARSPATAGADWQGGGVFTIIDVRNGVCHPFLHKRLNDKSNAIYAVEYIIPIYQEKFL
jgi:hypothetical protein